MTPWNAFAWSLLCPGLGQLYNGQPLKAASTYVGFWLAWFGIFFSFPYLFGSSGILWVCFETLVLRLAVGAEAFATARRIQDTPRRWYRHWACLLTAWILSSQVLGIVTQGTLPSWPARTYCIASGNMISTLCINDYVLADAWYYRKNPPAIGDIVVLHPPGADDRDQRITRIVGLGGDRLAVREGSLWRNGVKAT